jgi:hypothetical protein
MATFKPTKSYQLANDKIVWKEESMIGKFIAIGVSLAELPEPRPKKQVSAHFLTEDQI